MARLIRIRGAGGHGQDIAAIAEACGYEVEFYDDDPDKGFSPFPYVHEFSYAPDHIIGVNDPRLRRRLAQMVAAEALVHPTAVVPDPNWIGRDTVVGAGTIIGPGCGIGWHVHIGPGCTLTRTKVGAFTTISPGVNVAGDVTIGEECLIGVGATVSNLVTIGDRCTIGAGAVVIDDVPDDTTVVGVPARPLRRGGTA